MLCWYLDLSIHFDDKQLNSKYTGVHIAVNAASILVIVTHMFLHEPLVEVRRDDKLAATAFSNLQSSDLQDITFDSGKSLSNITRAGLL